jgi:thiamine kinase-like enzyme
MDYSFSQLEDVTPIDTGRTNISYILTSGSSKSILRISRDESLMHIFDRNFEKYVFITASKNDLAPSVISSGDNFIISKYYENHARPRIEEVLPALLSLHRLFTQRIDDPVFEGIVRRRIQVVRNHPENIPESYWHLERAALRITSSRDYLSLPRRLCHLDLTPRNILFTSGKIRFIDFEMSNWGPALLDLASLSVGYGLTTNDDRELFGQYNNRTTNKMYYMAKFCYRFRCILWLLIQQQLEKNTKLKEEDMRDLHIDIEQSLLCLKAIN